MSVIELSDCIPTIAELRRRAVRPQNRGASPQAMEEMERYLLGCGYTNANPEVYNVIWRYGAAELEQRNGRGLFLKGGCGIGKSFGIACLAAKFNWPVLPAKLLQTAYMSAERDDQFLRIVDALDWAGKAQTIVIDDLGAEDYPLLKFGTPCNLLADILDRRYYQAFIRDGLRTIVTCNLTDEQLRERYGVRIDDRMDEMFEFATVAGRSLRK